MSAAIHFMENIFNLKLQMKTDLLNLQGFLIFPHRSNIQATGKVHYYYLKELGENFTGVLLEVRYLKWDGTLYVLCAE